LLTLFPKNIERFLNSFSASLSSTEIITSQQATHMLEEELQKLQISASICKAITELCNSSELKADPQKKDKHKSAIQNCHC